MSALWPYFQRFLRYRTRLVAGLLCIPLAQLADIRITVYIGNAITRASTAEDTDWMRSVLIWLTVFALGRVVFRFLQRWLIVVVSRQVEVDLKQDTFDRLTRLSFDFHNRSRPGDVVSRLTSWKMCACSWDLDSCTPREPSWWSPFPWATCSVCSPR